MELVPNPAVPFSPPINLDFEFLPVDQQLLKDENVVNHERLKRIKEKVEKAASAAEKASRNFQKLYSTLRDLSTVNNDKNATWDAVVQKYIAEEGGKSIHAKMSIVNNSLIPPPPIYHNSQVRDPNRPKKPPNAFMMFLMEQCDEMKTKSSTGGLHAPHVGKIVSERWKELSHDRKKLYEDRYQISKKQYEENIKIYNANREEDIESQEITEEKTPIKIKQEEIEYDFASTSAATSTPPKRSKRNSKAKPSSSTSHDVNNKDVLTQNTGHRSIQQTPTTKIRKNNRKQRKVKDVNRPKKPANPYALYLAEQCSLMKQKSAPGALNAPHIGRVVSEQWRNLSKEDKQVYMDRYNIAKTNYDEEVLPPKLRQEQSDSSDEHDELEGTPLSNDDQEREHDELQDDYDVPLLSPTKSSSKENQEKMLPVAKESIGSSELEEMQDVEYSNGGNKNDKAESSIKKTKTTIDGEHPRTREALMVDIEITKKKHLRKRKSREEDYDGDYQRRKNRGNRREFADGQEESNEEDSAGDESDHSPLGTPSADGEISPSKWSLKGLFSGFKRPKFFQ
ncbi:12500_t:CDS:2 [Ambispora gerdemannii]|uniref:12500_t:CDS:1 n=1 Tax=Ambispora gerdemannii TaxID=144530 RepID=A0A9N8YIE1_9GLOM|nr:12500_t:CDS:2 [Ambispora gerdemannii]